MGKWLLALAFATVITGLCIAFLPTSIVHFSFPLFGIQMYLMNFVFFGAFFTGHSLATK